MLAYAAQGLPSDEGSASGSQIREFLRRCDAALTDLGNAITHCVSQLEDTSSQPYSVIAQPSIGSQLVDNLNASTHLRAVLTDLFLLAEILKF